MYWAFPGHRHVTQLRQRIDAGDYRKALELIEPVTRGFARLSPGAEERESSLERDTPGAELPVAQAPAEVRPRFEVLIVDDMSATDRDALQAEMLRHRRPADAFIYELTVVSSFEDALVAVLLNPDIQACVLRPGFGSTTRQRLGHDLRDFLAGFAGEDLAPLRPIERILGLADKIAQLRRELDLYMVTDVSVEHIAGSAGKSFHRVFHREDDLELHLSLLRGVAERYHTPFFTALQYYSRSPRGLPRPADLAGQVDREVALDQGHGRFYGLDIFMAETLGTSGGLDSLLEPTGPIKEAQELAAVAFGSRQTYFVTNGTSTANKIVAQALVAPGDIVLVDRNCHQSHHYGMMLAGAQVALPGRLPAERVLHVRRGAAARDQADAAGLAPGRAARPRQDGRADQLHLRRHRLRRRAGHGGVPGDQARPGVPVGRGLVRLRPLPPRLPAAHRDGSGARAARGGCKRPRLPAQHMRAQAQDARPRSGRAPRQRRWTSPPRAGPGNGPGCGSTPPSPRTRR